MIYTSNWMVLILSISEKTFTNVRKQTIYVKVSIQSLYNLYSGMQACLSKEDIVFHSMH